MVCAISPATINYEESLNTLWYAEWAKKVKNQAVINESAHDKMIWELKSENDKLKEFINMFAAGGISGLNLSDPSFMQRL